MVIRFWFESKGKYVAKISAAKAPVHEWSVRIHERHTAPFPKAETCRPMRSFDLMRPLSLLLLCLLPTALLAQHPSFWTLNHGQGLPSHKVYYLLEDSIGVIWMGTSEGLAHYDGLRLQVLRTPGARSDDRSILQPAPDGRVWSINFRGEMFSADYDTMVAMPQVLDGLLGKVLALERQGDSLLVLTDRELAVCHASGSRSRVLARVREGDVFLSSSADSLILSIYGVTDARIGMFSKNQIHTPTAWNVAGGKLFTCQKEKGVITLLSDPSDRTLISGLRRKGRPVPYITGVRVTGAGTWALTYDGAYLIEAGQWLFPGLAVSDVVEAQDGAHWFSTLTDGVKVVPDLSIRRYARDPDGLPTERFNRIRHLPNGNILASDNNGMIVLLHPKRGLLASFRADIDRESEVLEIDTVHGRILVAFGDLYLLDMNTLKLLQKMKGNFKGVVVADGVLYAVNSPNREHILYDGNRFGDAQILSELGQQAFAVMKDGTGVVWWLTNEGILTEDPDRIPPSLGGGQGEVFRNILGTADGRIILSGPPESIAIIHPKNELEWLMIPQHITEGRRVRSMDMHGNSLFILMSDAIGSFDFKRKEWRRIAGGNGLPATDLRDLRVLDNELWVASFNGLYALPVLSERTPCPPKVLLRSVRVNGEDRPLETLQSLRHGENNIEVVLRGISTASRGRMRFAYRLNGEGGFEESEGGSTLRFRALAPGDYTLEAIAISASGERSPQPLVLGFSIAKPWYATWPFILSMAVLLVAVVSAAFLLRIRYINQRNTEQVERTGLLGDLRQSRLTALRAQMNPHFMFNVLNSVQGLFNIGRAEKANEVLARFSDLMRTVLDMSGSELIPLSQELELIDLYLELEAVRFGDSFRYTVIVADDVRPEHLKVPSMLLQPYAENAVKHGLLHLRGEKRLDMSVVREGNVLRITIDDNGVGRKEAARLRQARHRSFATAATLSRVELLNAGRQWPIQVEVIDKEKDGKSFGTKVIILIPIDDETQ